MYQATTTLTSAVTGAVRADQKQHGVPVRVYTSADGFGLVSGRAVLTHPADPRLLDMHGIEDRVQLTVLAAASERRKAWDVEARPETAPHLAGHFPGDLEQGVSLRDTEVDEDGNVVALTFTQVHRFCVAADGAEIVHGSVFWTNELRVARVDMEQTFTGVRAQRPELWDGWFEMIDPVTLRRSALMNGGRLAKRHPMTGEMAEEWVAKQPHLRSLT
ncbi:hypothetical protein [Nocardia carnea]|uniref:hypothetical protein n=1 Tax=Nocardia carnea TaxID=37328 RepID=UPI0024563BE0|nr:hypothetical protein [Nocardia carnea]